MNKIIIISLIILNLFSLSSCGGSGGTDFNEGGLPSLADLELAEKYTGDLFLSGNTCNTNLPVDKLPAFQLSIRRSNLSVQGPEFFVDIINDDLAEQQGYQSVAGIDAVFPTGQLNPFISGYKCIESVQLTAGSRDIEQNAAGQDYAKSITVDRTSYITCTNVKDQNDIISCSVYYNGELHS